MKLCKMILNKNKKKNKNLFFKFYHKSILIEFIISLSILYLFCKFNLINA